MRWHETEASSDVTRKGASLRSKCPANLAPLAPLALSSKAPKDPQVQKDRLAPAACRVRWVPKARRATAEAKGLKALLDSLDRRVPLVTLEWLANEARKDRKGLSDHPVPLALTELLALRAIKARRVILDSRGHRVIPELLANPDPRVTLEMRDLRAYPEAADRRAIRASRESRATPENQDRREIPVQKVQRGRGSRPESS